MQKRTRYVVLAAAFGVGVPLVAAWCEGGGPGWFISCTNTNCTLTVYQGDGVWVATEVPRSEGDRLCDRAIEEPPVP